MHRAWLCLYYCIARSATGWLTAAGARCLCATDNGVPMPEPEATALFKGVY
eukprot:COSAG06_NODE_23593_length_687_cov_0.760204_1_plen_50_part_10